MIMDMATELRVAKMQLSDDPDDWCWARLYRARVGAKVRPGLSVWANPIWDDTNEEQPEQPSIRLQPSKNRPWRYSPYPGQHYLGDPDWYARGLPLSARVPGETGAGCGGDIWDARVGFDLGVTEEEPANLIGMGGGGEGGGPMAVTTACMIWYGEAVCMAGGAEGGGPMEIASPGLLGMARGGEGGGPMAFADASYVYMLGGGEGGGPMALVEGDSVLMDGGGEGGGPMEVTGSGPAFGVFGGPTQLNGEGLDLTVPDEAEDGSQLIVFALSSNGTVSGWTTPAGWTLAGSGNVTGSVGGWAVWTKVASGDAGGTFSTTFSADTAVAASVVAVVGGLGVSLGAPAASNGSLAEAPSVMVPLAGMLLLMPVAISASATPDDPPDDFEVVTEDYPGAGYGVYSREDPPTGSTGDVDLVLDSATDWVTMLVVVSPAP